MSYKVVKAFTDLQDNNHVYHTGDSFPRSGYKPSEDRVKELASKSNKRGVTLIEAIEDEVKHEAPAPKKMASDEEVEKAVEELHKKKSNKKKEK